MSICCIEKYRTLSLAHSDMAVAMAVVFDGGAFYTLLLKVPFIVSSFHLVSQLFRGRSF